MANATAIADVRAKINEPTPATWTDVAIGSVIDIFSNNDAAAAHFWRLKAAKYSELVDVQEGSSSRALGDLYEQALAMAAQFSSLVPTVPVVSTVMRPGRTRAITRP